MEFDWVICYIHFSFWVNISFNALPAMSYVLWHDVYVSSLVYVCVCMCDRQAGCLISHLHNYD